MLQLKVDSIDFREIRITDENGETKTYDIQEELVIHPHSVRLAFLEQPAKYAFWSSVLEKIKLYQESYELMLATKKAEVYELSRSDLIASGTAKPTKDQIEARVMLDPEVQELNRTVLQSTYNVRRLTTFVKAIEQRKDMLIQYGADLRREYEYGRKLSMPDLPEQQQYQQQQPSGGQWTPQNQGY